LPLRPGPRRAGRVPGDSDQGGPARGGRRAGPAPQGPRGRRGRAHHLRRARRPLAPDRPARRAPPRGRRVPVGAAARAGEPQRLADAVADQVAALTTPGAVGTLGERRRSRMAEIEIAPLSQRLSDDEIAELAGSLEAFGAPRLPKAADDSPVTIGDAL